MKKMLVFVLLLAASAASAQVIKCPERFPTKEIALADKPAGRHGSARLQPARLSNAYMTSGELYSEVEFVPDITKVEGGRNVNYAFTRTQANWLVCEYGGGERVGGTIQWWERLEPSITGCELRVRETRIRGSASAWAATAVCK
jgi:hypothetical protein